MENNRIKIYLKDNIPLGWYDFLKKDSIVENHNNIKFLEDEATNVTIYPSINNVFRSLYTVPLDKIK